MAIEIKSAPHRRIAVADIMPNPHRDMKTNPVPEDKVERLIESFQRTGFWDNIVVRPHPRREGKYELAYGHGRLTALKKARIAEITIPVAKLTDWQMYQAMVDENETQAEITPPIVMENVGVGARLIEQYVRQSKTAEEFAACFGRVASASEPPFTEKSFEQTKARIERGEGPGRDVLIALVPSAARHNNAVNEALNSIYGKAREAAKSKAAEAKRADAEAKRKKAEAQKDAERAKKLRAEAAEAEREADELEAEAAKLAKTGIAKEVLLTLPTPTHMAEFGQAVRRLGIPPARHHEAAAQVSDKAKTATRDVLPQLTLWWDVVSGESARRRERVEREKKLERLRKQVSGGDLAAFLMKLHENLGKLERDLRIAADYAEFASEKLRRNIVKDWPAYAELINTIVERAGGSVGAQYVQPAQPKMLTHQ